MDKCSNPLCSETAKSKCAACATVAYCGQDCQKAHWQLHKKACKAARAPAAISDGTVAAVKTSPASKAVTIPDGATDIATRLHKSKQETQQSFNTGDFTSSVKCGNDALKLAKLLPEPASSIEAIQIHLNMTTAYIQLKKSAEAKIHSSLCVEMAERSLAIRQGEPQAVEMLVVALGCRSYVLVADNKLDEADVHALRALSLAEQIFVPNDARLYKSIRAVGTIRDKQNKIDEAAKYYQRAFDIAFEGQGPVHQETLQVIDELVNVLLKKGELPAAETLVRKCYDAAITCGIDKDNLLIGDAAGRLATVLAKGGKETEAEPYMKQALQVREKCLGLNHPLIGITLGFMAGIYEAQGNYSEETENLLLRAMDIFRQAEGPQGPHVMTSLGHIQRIQKKRDGRYSAEGTIEEEDDEGIEEVSTRGAQRISAAQKEKIREMLDIKFEAGDGVGRMRHAAYCFELQEFAKAETLTAEAYDIFLRDNGPTHPSTAAARQNLEVVRTNALNQLWHEVARDEIEKLVGSAASPSSPVRVNSPGIDSGSQKEKSVSTGKKVQAGDSGGVEDVTWCEPQQLSPEDEWLFRDQPKSGGCTIC